MPKKPTMNKRRLPAKWRRGRVRTMDQVLRRYQSDTENVLWKESDETNLADMLADLMIWAVQSGVSFGCALEWAHRLAEIELSGAVDS